jgi:hypothetical protein
MGIEKRRQVMSMRALAPIARLESEAAAIVLKLRQSAKKEDGTFGEPSAKELDDALRQLEDLQRYDLGGKKSPRWELVAAHACALATVLLGDGRKFTVQKLPKPFVAQLLEGNHSVEAAVSRPAASAETGEDAPMPYQFHGLIAFCAWGDPPDLAAQVRVGARSHRATRQNDLHLLMLGCTTYSSVFVVMRVGAKAWAQMRGRRSVDRSPRLL